MNGRRSLSHLLSSQDFIHKSSMATLHSKQHLLYGKPLPFVLVSCPFLSVMATLATPAIRDGRVRLFVRASAGEETKHLLGTIPALLDLSESNTTK